MNETNRTAIVLFAALMIVVMAVVIFVTWAADDKAIDRLGDMVEYMGAHRDNAGRLIVTLTALIVAVLSLLVIIVEFAPEDEEKELRVQQAGATTIVPAQALRARLEEALTALPEVTASRARVATRDKGISASLDLTVTPGANVGALTQDAIRVVVDTVQTDLGLPVSGVPTVRVVFGGPKLQPVASSIAQVLVDAPGRETTAEATGAAADATLAEPAVIDPLEDSTPPAGQPPSGFGAGDTQPGEPPQP